VPEQHVARIRAGLAPGGGLAVEAWDREQRVRLASGRVVATDNAIDPATGTLRLKAQFDNADGRLFANQFVNLRLQLDTLAGALVVPQSALMRAAQGAYVFVVKDDGTATIQSVRPGESDGEWVAVLGELRAGQRVVVDGTDRLREGSRVEVISRPKMRPPEAPAAAVPAGTTASAARSASAAAAASKPAASAGTRPGRATAGEDRPEWVKRLPPDEAAKVMKQSPEERQATLRKLVKARADQEADALAGSHPPDWFRQLPAASREKLLALSPEQRRAWLLKRMLNKAEQ